MVATKSDNLTGADKQWGYRFGIDGLMTREEVAELFRVTTRTVDEWCRQGRYRKGKLPGSSLVRICKRSVNDRVHEMEI